MNLGAHRQERLQAQQDGGTTPNGSAREHEYHFENFSGDFLRPSKYRVRSLMERFESYIDRGDCWIWNGPRDKDNRPHIGIGTSRNEAAARVSWRLYIGPVPPGSIVVRGCVSKDCVSPHHLRCVTKVAWGLSLRRLDRPYRKRSMVVARRTLLERQRGKCAACSCDIRKRSDVDHIVPVSAGGSNELGNLQLLCQTCNRSKGAKDPISFMRSRGLLL